jgi:hypothetical protein
MILDQQKTPPIFVGRVFKTKVVVDPGLEPGTHGFSVRCSTN